MTWGRPARYDDRLLPLGHLFGRRFLDDVEPGGSALEAEPEVYLVFKDEIMMPVPLPPFGNGGSP